MWGLYKSGEGEDCTVTDGRVVCPTLRSGAGLWALYQGRGKKLVGGDIAAKG